MKGTSDMSNKLNEARKIINDTDKKMAELFVKRMKATELVYEYKKEFGLPILDTKREYEVIEKLLPWLDCYLMDIKHTNTAKHKEFTGRSNELMLENARRIAESGQTTLVIRVPVIPGFNDRVDEIEGIARFADNLPGVKKIHLLPYHRLGQDKYEGLGREYLMGDVLPPTNEKMETLRQAVLRVSKLDCQIGG